LRFEIVGRMPGSVATVDPVTVRNISPGGALVEAPFTLPVNSWHAVRLGSEATFGTLDARVCHVAASTAPSRYLIGLEFVTPDALTAGRIEQIVSEAVSPSLG
jgi:hypothetical protein